MKACQRNNSGFTLVELVFVVFILSVVMGSVFTLYNTHLKNAYRQDENLDVQQNLRLAMDTLNRDLKMAGMLVPIAATPLFNSTTALANYSSSMIINVSSPDGIYARIVTAKTTGASGSTFTNITTHVDSAQAVDAFLSTNKATDRIRIISPFDNSVTLQATGADTSIALSALSNRNSPCIGLKGAGTGATIAGGITLSVGDIIAKGAGTGSYDTITYTLAPGTGTGVSPGNGCLAGQSCLFRSVNGAAPGDVVAGNLSSLRFSYVFSDNTENNNPILAYVSTIKSVRVTLTGVPASAITAGDIAQKTRQITSVVMLRNRRTN
jgi:prepilin-type N-terminal cleavage/methylation domain-containing protein